MLEVYKEGVIGAAIKVCGARQSKDGRKRTSWCIE